jgi:predicted HicB family RNase H-like nuclease
MNYKLKYRGFRGSVSDCTSDGIVIGRIEAIPDVVTFEARNVQRLKQEFEIAVYCYLEFCQVESVYLDRNKS